MFIFRFILALPSQNTFSLLRILRNLYGSIYADARVCLILIFLSTIGCGISNENLIEQYNDFAIRAAKADLWNEAILRWQRIIEIDPNNAKAHNNLGVAYEAMERFDEALQEYEKAIELDPGNEVYRRNFFRCQRNKGRFWHTKRNSEGK